MEFVTATFQAALGESDKIVKHVLKYVVNHRAQINELGESIEQLEKEVKRVQCDIEAAKRNLQKKDADDLKEWSDGAEKMIEEAEKIIFEHEEKMMCCNGRCPNLISRYHLSKKACHRKSNLEKKKGESPTIVIEVGSDWPIGGMGNVLSTRGYMEFKSRESVYDKVMGALEDGNVRMVGVFGMAGSGKTMLVKKIAEQAKQKGLFDEVIVTVVSETPNFKNIQDQIAENLGLNLFGGNQDVRADRLHERLKDEKKTLIILDDIWKRSGLDMNALGISFGNDQKGCKLLVTSRDQCVLSNDLNIEKFFKVNPLEPEEAMFLFKEIVGKFDPKFEKTVVEAVAECGGVPLAITTVANALKKKTPDHWSGALQKLRMSKPTGMDGPHDPMYSAIKFSYDYLESKEEQLLFLLCSLHAEDQEISIDNLLRYGVGYVQSDIYDVGLGVFQGAYTMEQARTSLNASIKSLKDCFLLLDGNDGGTIKMHDVTRDAAIKIAKEKFIFIVKEALDLERRSKSKDLIALSLPYGYVGEHLERLVCPQLKLFFLFNIKNSLQIPNGFFEEIKELSVLSLNGIRLSLHDSSLQFLQNLQTLCLVGCKLDNIAVIGELKDLKVLSLAWSSIKRLPKEIGNLHRLQLLDLGNCSRLQVIESYVLSKLKRLNELYIENSFNQWEVEEPNASGSYARVSELNHLSHLTTLNIHIPNARNVPNALCFKNLVRYKILIGDNWDWTNTGSEFSLKINIDGRFQFEDGIKTLLKKCEVLYLGEMKGVDKILYKDCEGFPKLKYLDIKNNADIQYIIYSKEVRQIAFRVLESMFLRNMIKLEKIFNRDFGMECFRKLTKVYVEGCDSLKFVFYVSMTQLLLQLQEMVIHRCKEMVAVVKGSEPEIENNDYTMEFNQLRFLELRFLPKLICFSSNFDSESSDLHPLFNEKVAFRLLETLNIYEIDHLKMIWHDQLEADSFCKLKELYITECQSLEKIFLPNTLRTLRSLEELRISNCQSTEEVFAMRGMDVPGDSVQLKYLDLQNLQNLKYIWSLDRGAIFTFKNLYEVKVVDCNSLKCLFPASVAKDLEQLTLLEIYQCGVEEVAEREELETSESNVAFARLTFLRLEQLPELKSFYRGKCELRCPLLKELKICNCDKLKIFGSEDTSQQTPFFIDKHTFPNLEELTLKWDATLNNTYGRFPNEFFCGLKFLELNGAPFEEICPYFSEEEQHSATFEHLAKLKLRKMPRLKHIWKDNSKPFIKLQKLVVSECDRLETFVPSSTFFENLKKLKVSKCQQLISLLTPSTVKSLLQLKKMVIFECVKMTEVVANEGSEGDEITFSQLKSLELRCLRDLTKFHSGNCKIIFPSLEKLTVVACPKLKIFSEEVSAPKLKGVQMAK